MPHGGLETEAISQARKGGFDAIDVNMFGFVRTESKFIALVARRHVLTAVIFHVRSCSLKFAETATSPEPCSH